jgi:trehalose/maltose hydrolase-like predicted phosphorylase
MYLPEDKERGIFLQQDDFLDKDIRPVSEIPKINAQLTNTGHGTRS